MRTEELAPRPSREAMLPWCWRFGGFPSKVPGLQGALKTAVAAVSVGIVNGVPCLDLHYDDDKVAEVDMNVVKTAENKYVEVQGTAESVPFDRAGLDRLLALADKGIEAALCGATKGARALKPALLLATENKGKLKEFQSFLGDSFHCLSSSDSPLPPHGKIEIIEDGTTYFENALKKAVGYFTALGVPVLSDDSGLEVDALGGAPGVFSARFGGVGISWPDRWAHLHKALSSSPPERRSARFRCVLCYYDGKGVPVFFDGVAEGRIVSEPKGGKGFGYDPIFYSTVLKKTFAEATEDEKSRFSHRAEAIRGFLEWWRSRPLRA